MATLLFHDHLLLHTVLGEKLDTPRLATLMVLPPKRPLEPLASSSPSGDSAMQQGQVVSSCRPCRVRRQTHMRVLHACMEANNGALTVNNLDKM